MSPLLVVFGVVLLVACVAGLVGIVTLMVRGAHAQERQRPP